MEDRIGELERQLGIDKETPEVRAVEITGSHIGDAPVLPDHVFPADWQGPDCRAGVSNPPARYPKPRLDDLEAATASVPCKLRPPDQLFRRASR
jgi:hypothetical protein